MKPIREHEILFERGNFPLRTSNIFHVDRDNEAFVAMEITRLRCTIDMPDLQVQIVSRGNRRNNHSYFAAEQYSLSEFIERYHNKKKKLYRRPEAKLEIVLGIIAEDGTFKALSDERYFDRSNAGLCVRNYDTIPPFELVIGYTLFAAFPNPVS